MIEVRIMIGNVWHAYDMNKEVYDEFKKWIIYEDTDIKKKFQHSCFGFTDRNDLVCIFRNHVQVIRISYTES